MSAARREQIEQAAPERGDDDDARTIPIAVPTRKARSGTVLIPSSQSAGVNWPVTTLRNMT